MVVFSLKKDYLSLQTVAFQTSKTAFLITRKFILFGYKMSLIVIILVFPNIILLFIPYLIYDGLRFFLWSL